MKKWNKCLVNYPLKREHTRDVCSIQNLIKRQQFKFYLLFSKTQVPAAWDFPVDEDIISQQVACVFFCHNIVLVSAILIWCLEERGMLQQPIHDFHTLTKQNPHMTDLFTSNHLKLILRLSVPVLFSSDHTTLFSYVLSRLCLLCSCCCFGVQRSDAAL